MADGLVQKQVQCLQVAVTTTSGAIPVQLNGIKRVIMQNVTNDVYMDIDQPVAPTTSFRLFAANNMPTTVETDQGLMNKLYFQAVTGSATVYLILIAG